MEPAKVANRIDPTTVATARLEPAAGGWQPSFLQRIALTTGSTTLAALVPVFLSTIPGALGLVLSAIAGGGAAGLGTLAGINSAGPRRFQ